MLEAKLAEAHGLAIAAATVAPRVSEIVEQHELAALCDELRAETDQVRARCAHLEQEMGKELLAHANSTAARSLGLLEAWFTAGTDPLAAWTFLAMTEAAEVSTWAAIATLSRGGEVAELASWALELQRRHLRVVLDSVGKLASEVLARSTEMGLTARGHRL